MLTADWAAATINGYMLGQFEFSSRVRPTIQTNQQRQTPLHDAATGELIHINP